MKQVDYRPDIAKWVAETSEYAVEQELMTEVRAPTTRSRLLKGNYPNPPTGLLAQAIERVLARNGRLPRAEAG